MGAQSAQYLSAQEQAIKSGNKVVKGTVTDRFLRMHEAIRAYGPPWVTLGGTEKFQSDPHGRDHILFYEYLHGDNGAGLGASHQTGWIGLVAKMIQLFGLLDPKKTLQEGKSAAFGKGGAGTR